MLLKSLLLLHDRKQDPETHSRPRNTENLDPIFVALAEVRLRGHLLEAPLFNRNEKTAVERTQQLPFTHASRASLLIFESIKAKAFCKGSPHETYERTIHREAAVRAGNETARATAGKEVRSQSLSEDVLRCCADAIDLVDGLSAKDDIEGFVREVRLRVLPIKSVQPHVLFEGVRCDVLLQSWEQLGLAIRERDITRGNLRERQSCDAIACSQLEGRPSAQRAERPSVALPLVPRQKLGESKAPRPGLASVAGGARVEVLDAFVRDFGPDERNERGGGGRALRNNCHDCADGEPTQTCNCNLRPGRQRKHPRGTARQQRNANG